METTTQPQQPAQKQNQTPPPPQPTGPVTVTECSELKKWKDKQIYKIGLSDKTYGESFQKIPVGTPASDLTIEQGQYSRNIKWNKSSSGGGRGGRPPENKNESFALAYAKDIAVAIVNHMPVEMQPSAADIAKVAIGIAEPFYQWLEAKRKTH